MTHYSIQPSDQIFVKGYGFLPFAKNMLRKIGKNINKNLSSKIARNFLIILNNQPCMHLKLLQKDSKNNRSNW